MEDRKDSGKSQSPPSLATGGQKVFLDISVWHTGMESVYKGRVRASAEKSSAGSSA